MKKEIIQIDGSVQLMKNRKWWQPWKRGWHKHTGGFGERMWIRFNWDLYEDVQRKKR